MSGLLAALLLVFGASIPVLADDFNRNTLNGVIFIMEDIVIEGKEYGAWTGTGFFVGEQGKDPQYIVTNYHVIRYYVLSGGGQGQSSLTVAFDQNDVEEAYVVAYDEEKDLAILKLGAPTDKRVPLQFTSPTEELVGKTVFAVGYPGVADETFNYRLTTMYGKDDATVTGGRVNRILTESGTGRKLLQMDVNIRGGNSGGPLVDEDGHVIGINTLSSNLADNLNYAVSVDELFPLLTNNNIPYEMAKSGPGAVLWIVLVVVVLAVAAAVFLLMKKKKTGENTPAPKAKKKAATPGKPALRSMAAQHNGMTVSLEGGSAVIGRDVSACKIVFREGTAGVSSRHCSVAWDAAAGNFVLTDMNSTYGTFLANGQKLMPGVPYVLNPKDSFYLGERDNTLYVDLV